MGASPAGLRRTSTKIKIKGKRCKLTFKIICLLKQVYIKINILWGRQWSFNIIIIINSLFTEGYTAS
jgi:hypothetical protein